MTTLLETRDLTAGYGTRRILNAVNCKVEEGEIVALIGHNGAGKSTLLKTIFGVVPRESGEVIWRGQPMRLGSSADAARTGLRLVPEGTPVFADLTVAENIAIGATAAGSGELTPEADRMVQALFPRLRERQRQLAGTLSGGERKMLGIAMALVTRPALLLLDEPSLGLAPVLVQDLFARIARIRAEAGLSILLVEQNVKRALEIADRVYVMKLGSIISARPAKEITNTVELLDLF